MEWDSRQETKTMICEARYLWQVAKGMVHHEKSLSFVVGAVKGYGLLETIPLGDWIEGR